MDSNNDNFSNKVSEDEEVQSQSNIDDGSLRKDKLEHEDNNHSINKKDDRDLNTMSPEQNQSSQAESIPSPANKSCNWSNISALKCIAVLSIIVIGSVFLIFHAMDGGLYPSGDKVAVIYVQGPIVTGNLPTESGYASSENIAESLHQASSNDNVKSIVLRINSQGGSPAASEEITREINKVQEQDIPVVISMGESATSAAYYISSSADYIVANPSTFTGAIGAMWIFQDLSEAYEEEGIDIHVAKSGELKDMGAPWRELTEDEKEYADKVVMEIFDHFISEVADGREMNESYVKNISDGRVYTGTKAKDLGLIDEIGNLYDAIEIASEMGNIEGDYQVIYTNRPTTSRFLTI